MVRKGMYENLSIFLKQLVIVNKNGYYRIKAYQTITQGVDEVYLESRFFYRKNRLAVCG